MGIIVLKKKQYQSKEVEMDVWLLKSRVAGEIDSGTGSSSPRSCLARSNLALAYSAEKALSAGCLW